MELKQYQRETLDVLRRFFEEARVAGPKNAYETITAAPECAERLGRYRGPYTAALADLPEVPYVCLRLPTGGGKTILGAHAVRVARDAWIEKDWPLVLWLAPTTTIRRQTAEAFKKAGHPYREALDEAFGGRVRVFDIADFPHIRPQDLRDHCCLVVGTIQTLRVNNTEGRKVYAHHEDLEPHFSAVPATLPGLEQLAGGGVKFSFANLLHLHRPLMIVDEAHNAVTGLTRAMQTRVNPCAIVEFTATPRAKSNILYSVSAQELKREEMIKLPVILSENDTWQNAVNGAVAKRAALAAVAQEEPGGIRPIVLFQAQKKNQEVPVEALKRHLIDVEQVSEDRIAVATGDQRELDGIDLFDPHCPIEHVITVEALKEGWDCSFAYVFCSVARLHSAQHVEQLFGRVLRMPFARRRQAAALNRAYAYASEPSVGEAAKALVDKLVNMGFEEDEAHDNVQLALPADDAADGLFGPPDPPTFSHVVPAAPATVAALEAIAHERLTVGPTADGAVEITVTGPVDERLETALYDAAGEADRSGIAEAIERYRATTGTRLSPAQRGEPFTVPRLVCEIQGNLEFADTDVFMEFIDWSPLNHPARLDEREFTVRQTERSFEIDLDGRQIRHQFLDAQEQLALNVAVEGWTPERLVVWLERQVREIDLDPDALRKWLSDLVRSLTDQRGMSIAALMRCKFILARKIRDKIAAMRREEEARAYQRYLFAPEARVETTFDAAFVFRDGMYADQRRYRGHWKPSKHFLGPDAVPAFDGAAGGEEEQCAQALDRLPEVTYWIRNVARHPASFWLPTATGKFYPDFVALLNDGRRFVVEYKGAHIADGPDTDEKRAVGALWEQRSEGKGLFLMAEKQRDGLGVWDQLRSKVAR